MTVVTAATDHVGVSFRDLPSLNNSSIFSCFQPFFSFRKFSLLQLMRETTEGAGHGQLRLLIYMHACVCKRRVAPGALELMRSTIFFASPRPALHMEFAFSIIFLSFSCWEILNYLGDVSYL